MANVTTSTARITTKGYAPKVATRYRNRWNQAAYQTAMALPQTGTNARWKV